MINDSEFTEEQKRTLAEKQKEIDVLQAQIAAQRKEKEEWEREHFQGVGRPSPSIGSMLLTDEIRKQAERVQPRRNSRIPPHLEKNHVIPPSSQDEALALDVPACLTQRQDANTHPQPTSCLPLPHPQSSVLGC